MVVQNVDKDPGAASLVGELHAVIGLAMNCIGYVTNGAGYCFRTFNRPMRSRSIPNAATVDSAFAPSVKGRRTWQAATEVYD